LAPKAIATRVAFDLVPADDGALFVFGPPSATGGGVRVSTLGPLGQRGDEAVIWAPNDDPRRQTPYAVEIAAASAGGRVGIAWVAQDGADARTFVSHGARGAYSPPEDLGTMELPRGAERGNVALAGAPDGALSLIHRRDRGPCADGAAADCDRLAVRRLDGDGVSERSGMPLVIPEVCDQPVPGYVWSDGTWYYALCALTEGLPETTLYAIRFEPRYAQADRVLRGCTPIGLGAATEGAALMFGRCDGGQRVDGVRVASMGTELSLLADARRSVVCRGGRPELNVEAGAERVVIGLGEVRAGLAPLLPEEVAPPRSRAIWTGQSILVAAPVGHEVSLRRYQCEDGVFLRTDLL
jgi:hypothetical protein